jgi:hypothetical protein
MEGKNWFKERQESLNRFQWDGFSGKIPRFLTREEADDYNRRQDQILAKSLNPPQQQQSSQPIGKATLGYQLQGPPGKPYGFRNPTTGAYEWFATMDELNAAQQGQQVKQSSLPSDPYSNLQNQVSGLEKAKGISDPYERSAFMRKERIDSGGLNDLQTIEERIALFKSRLPRKGQPTSPRTDLDYDPSKSSFSRAMQDLQNMRG